MQKRFNETLFTPILIIVIFALILAANFIPKDTLGMDDNPYLAAVAIQLLTYALPALFYCRLRGRDFTGKLRLRFFPPSQLLYLFYAFGFLVCGSFIISIFMYNLSPEAFAASAVTESAAFAMNNRFFDTAYIVVVFAVLPAVTEEFVFRGIVNGEYENRGVGFAVTVSSLMFAMSHFSLERFPVYIFAGIVLSCIMYATRSTLAAIIVHAAHNIVVLLCEKYVLRVVDKQNASLVLLLIIIGAVTLLFGMLSSFEAQGIYRKYADDNVPSEYAEAKKQNIFSKVAQVFFTPTFLILVIMFVIAMVAIY